MDATPHNVRVNLSDNDDESEEDPEDDVMEEDLPVDRLLLKDAAMSLIEKAQRKVTCVCLCSHVCVCVCPCWFRNIIEVEIFVRVHTYVDACTHMYALE